MRHIDANKVIIKYEKWQIKMLLIQHQIEKT